MDSIASKEGSVGPYFGLPHAPCLSLKPMKAASFSVTRLRRAVADGTSFIVELPPQDAYFMMVYLRNVRHCDIIADGSRTDVTDYRKGSVCLVDLTDGASICLYSDLDALAFRLPQSLFDELIERSTEAQFRKLRCKRGEIDSVMRNLGVALLPLFEASPSKPPAALQHIAIATCAHLLHNYSDVPLGNSYKNGSLSPWQEKTAKEFMIDHFRSDISVTAIAASAGLSSGHFSQGFKNATGQTPHQWLIRLRVERAKDLLANRSMNLSIIAEECGFTDQSHFTKVFSRETGMTPAVWRNRGLQ